MTAKKVNLDTIGPGHIVEFLDKHVAGQTEAKKALAYAIFMQLLKRQHAKEYELEGTAEPLRTPNILLMGPSGCGKTFLVQTVCHALGIPFTVIDATALSLPGWKGESLEDLVLRGARKHSRNPTNFEYGVVFIDEIDKMCVPLKNSDGTDFNRATQFNLLTFIEGTRLESRSGDIHTRNMLFIFAGNFEEIRKKRERENKTAIGFADRSHERKKLDKHKELIDFGMITELAGRISSVAEVTALTRKELKKALFVEDGPLIDYVTLLHDTIGYDLTLTSKDVKLILDIAEKSGVGARGLQRGVDEVLSKQLLRKL